MSKDKKKERDSKEISSMEMEMGVQETVTSIHDSISGSFPALFTQPASKQFLRNIPASRGRVRRVQNSEVGQRRG